MKLELCFGKRRPLPGKEEYRAWDRDIVQRTVTATETSDLSMPFKVFVSPLEDEVQSSPPPSTSETEFDCKIHL